MRTGYTAESSSGCAGLEGSGRNPQEYAHGVVSRPCVGRYSDPSTQQLLEQVIESENMRLAWKQVKRNGGVAGVDGRSIEETAEFLRYNWLELRQSKTILGSDQVKYLKSKERRPF